MSEDVPETTIDSAEPLESGVVPAQSPTEAVNTDVLGPEWKEQSPLTDALRELGTAATSNARSLYILSAAGAQMMHEECRSLKRELALLRTRYEKMLGDYNDKKIECAVLIERLSSAPRKEVMLIIGSLAGGAAITIYLSPGSIPTGFAHILALFAVVLITTAYFGQRQEKKP